MSCRMTSNVEKELDFLWWQTLKVIGKGSHRASVLVFLNHTHTFRILQVIKLEAGICAAG